MELMREVGTKEIGSDADGGSRQGERERKSKKLERLGKAKIEIQRKVCESFKKKEKYKDRALS